MIARSIRTRVLMLALGVGLGMPTIAQEPGFHDAWLEEALTLRVAEAATTYRRIAFDPESDWSERMLARGRLLELHHAGGPTLDEDDLGRLRRQMPRPLQGAIRRLETAGDLSRELLERGDRDPGSVASWLASAEVPAIRIESRPLLTGILDWLGQNPARASDRQLLQRELRLAQRDGQAERVRELRRRLLRLGQEASDRRGLRNLRGYLILRRELEGRVREAEQLRRIWFPQPAMAARPDDLDLVLRRLSSWTPAPQAPPGEAELIATLAKRLLELRQQDEGQAAIDLIARLPFYRERLLRE